MLRELQISFETFVGFINIKWQSSGLAIRHLQHHYFIWPKSFVSSRAIPTLVRAGHSPAKWTEVTNKAGLRGGADGQVTRNGRWEVNGITGNAVLVNSGFQHPNKHFRKSLAIRAHITNLFVRPVIGRILKKKKNRFEGHQIISQPGAPTRIGLNLVTNDTGQIR